MPSTQLVRSGDEVVTLFHASRCRCGETLWRGERVGVRGGSRSVSCLPCLADEGRPAPSSRPRLVLVPATGAVAPAAPLVSPAPADDEAPAPGVWFALLVPVAAVMAVLAAHWPASWPG